MATLTSILQASTKSLSSYTTGIRVVQRNIANATTDGYARERVAFEPFGNIEGLGVGVAGVQSFRNRLLDLQAYQANQRLAFFEKKTELLAKIESPFRIDGERSVSGDIDAFFGAVGQLATAPTDLNLRQEVIAAGRAVASTVRTTTRDLSDQRASLDTEARTVVAEINDLLNEIGDLASRRKNADGSPNQATNTRLAQTYEELSQFLDFRVIYDNNDLPVLTTDGGVSLAVGANVRNLGVQITDARLDIVDADGQVVTDRISTEGGGLSAILDVRNNSIPGYLDDLNKLVKGFADRVNEQLRAGVDLTGSAGQKLFLYNESAVTGTGRTAGTAGAATPPPIGLQVDFTGGVTGSISLSLDSFVVGTAPPTAATAGDTVSVDFAAADGTVSRITTSPLLGGETTAQIAQRLNDQVAITPELAGLVSFSDNGGNLKVILAEGAGQAYSFTSATSNAGFTTGLEAGGSLGSQSAEEIVAALNTEVEADPALYAAGVRFVASGGEIRLDGDPAFDFTVTETPGATGFVSGLPATGSAGGANASFELTAANLTPEQIAAGAPGAPAGNENLLLIDALGEQATLNSGQSTFSQFYSRFVQQIGLDSAGSFGRAEAQARIAQTAEELRDQVSGVDINEEAVRLVELERSYQAVGRVFQVVNDLSDLLINLGR